MLRAKLVVVGGDARQAEVKLRLPLIIGRGRDVGLTVPHVLVSRRHSEIIERDGRLVVRDLGSLNGTFVDNQRIETEQVLEPGQLLTLGNITFRAVYEAGESEHQEDLEVSGECSSRLSTGNEVDSSAKTKWAGEPIRPSKSDLIRHSETVPVETFPLGVDTEPSAVESRPENTSSPGGVPVAKSDPSFSRDVVFQAVESVASPTKSFGEQDLEPKGDGLVGSPEDSSLGSLLRKLPR